MNTDLITFLKEMKFPSPLINPPPSSLRPYQEDLAVKYLVNQKLFVGVSRQIGTTCILAGIAAWEMLTKPGITVATDSENVFLKGKRIAIEMAERENVLVARESALELMLSNGSKLIRLPPCPCKGYMVDVMLLEPASTRIKPEDFQSWYAATSAMIRPSTGKLLVAALPEDKIKPLYKSWIAAGWPTMMLDYAATGVIERHGIDWLFDQAALLGKKQFRIEYCCDFSD
jgi:hypothetical protein